MANVCTVSTFCGPYIALERFSKALYGTSGGTYSAQVFRPVMKLVLQTLGKLAIRLQALDRKLFSPRTFSHFRLVAAHAQAQAQSAKSFVALWNWPKLVLQTLGKPGSRLKALDRKLNMSRIFTYFRSGAAHAQAQVQSAKNFLHFRIGPN